MKALLPADAYAALKASRQKGSLASPSVAVTPAEEPEADSLKDDDSSLALDDADDFGEDPDEELTDDDDNAGAETFTELVPLLGVGDLSDCPLNQAQPFSVDLLPDSAYMLVDKVVELDARPLREFPELGLLDDAEQERQGLYLFVSPRAAKRQCGRSQRVSKLSLIHI